MASNVDDKINKVLKKLGLDLKLKEKQRVCIEKLLVGQDVFAVLPTGYGKSLIYQLLPYLMHDLDLDSSARDFCIVMVVSPLVSLMKDQVAHISSCVPCAYLGELQSAETIEKINSGMIPLLFVSPEGLFGGSWRDLILTQPYQKYLTTVVVDECHCVQQWGEQFRKDYSKLGELRSLLPKANFLALTATATPEDRKDISKTLYLNNASEVIASCDRSNIFHASIKAPNEVFSSFSWLVSDLKAFKNQTPKTIIYCRNIKACGILYKFLKEELGDHSYVGLPSARNCLFGMFHHSTAKRNKNIIMDLFPKKDCKTRVVIATSAFGMGVDVPDIRQVIHWGAPHSINSYQQQCGRAGRDGEQAHSIVYYHPHDVSISASDEPMRSFCKDHSCRRKFLVQQFTPEYMSSFRSDKHTCCDICKQICNCGQCPDNHHACLDADDQELVEAVTHQEQEMQLYRSVSTEQQYCVRSQILVLRKEMLHVNKSLLNIGLLTCLSDKVVSDILAYMPYVFCVEDLVTEFAFDHTCAQSIFNIIDSVLKTDLSL